MKVLIHGAINGSNFGDCLFAHIFYEELRKNHTVDFFRGNCFGLCEYLEKELPHYIKSFSNFREADCLVYMSGGYFGDTTSKLSEAVKRYFRYFRIANYFIKNHKPIYICGVGGGPIHNPFLRKKIINIINSAKFVSFRDQETANYFKKYGVDREIYVTTDTALSINTLKIPSLDCNFESLMREKKNIFFHVYGSDKTNYELAEKLLPALNHFLLEHPNEYRVFVGTDNLCRKKIQELDIYKSLCADKIPVNYSSTWAMCSLLKSMNTVLTVKLHVGIVSSLYGKSVISIPKHVTKTKRFYKQIGASDRSTLLKEATADEVYRKLCQYADMPIQVPVELQEKAWLNIPQI